MASDEEPRAIAEERTPFGDLPGVKIVSITHDRIEADRPVDQVWCGEVSRLLVVPR